MPEPKARAGIRGGRRGGGGVISEADRHLRSVDHVLRRLIDERGPIDPETDRRGSRPDAYQALARAIVGQQLSTKAAASIWGRVTDHFDGETPSPQQLL